MSLPSTHWSILGEVHGADAIGPAAWQRFLSVYREPMVQWFLGRRLQPADAEDSAQAVLLRLFEHLNKFDPTVGSFRPWLRTLLSNALTDHFRAIERRPGNFAAGGSSVAELLAEISSPGSLDGLCAEVEACRDRRLEAAIAATRSRVDARSWSVFEAVVLKSIAAKDIAAELGLSVGSIHQIRYRLTKMLKEAYSESGVDA